MAGLELNKTGTDQKEHMLLFVCSEAVESKLVKLETRSTVFSDKANRHFIERENQRKERSMSVRGREKM